MSDVEAPDANEELATAHLRLMCVEYTGQLLARRQELGATWQLPGKLLCLDG